MAAPGPSATVARAGLHLVFAPGTPPLGDEAAMPITLAFQTFWRAKRENPDDDAWLTLIVQHASELTWLRVRVFPDMHTLGNFPENAVRISCRGHAIELNDDNTDGARFRFNLEMSIDDRAPREILGTLTLSPVEQ